MLQFNTVVCNASAKFTSRLWWKLSIPLTTNAAVVTNTASQQVKKRIENNTPKPRTNFKSLKTKVCNFLHTKSVDIIDVQNAKNIEEIMKITKTSLLSPEDNAKIKEIIDTWVADNNKIKESITSSQSPSNQESIDTGKAFIDVDTKYRLLSTSALIAEVAKFSDNRDRNVPILRHLFDNIIKYNNMLNPGQCSNLLFSMCKLNFSDERLLNKICFDLERNIFPNKQSHITKLISIITSMANIRYKNNDFLSKMCSAIINKKYVLTSVQISKLLQSLAILGYESEATNNIIDEFLPNIINRADGFKYLYLIWSLTIFNKVNSQYVRKLFDNDFITTLIPNENCFEADILKLLNINAYAKYILKDYSGPFLSDTVAPLTKKPSKQKKLYIEILEDTLKNVLPSPSYFKMNVNTNMGFLLDAELYLDSNSRPVCADNVEGDYKKIGMMIFDYYDLSLGSLEPLGLFKLYTRLLEARQYNVICIPYHHFGIEDKTEKRVLYLRNRLWNRYENDILKVSPKK